MLCRLNSNRDSYRNKHAQGQRTFKFFNVKIYTIWLNRDRNDQPIYPLRENSRTFDFSLRTDIFESDSKSKKAFWSSDYSHGRSSETSVLHENSRKTWFNSSYLRCVFRSKLIVEDYVFWSLANGLGVSNFSSEYEKDGWSLTNLGGGFTRKMYFR